MQHAAHVRWWSTALLTEGACRCCSRSREHMPLSITRAIFGQVLRHTVAAALPGLRAALVAPPEQAAWPEARGQRRVGELVGALQRARADSRSALAAAWRRDPAWLRRELAAWVRPRASGLSWAGHLHREAGRGLVLRAWCRRLCERAAPGRHREIRG